MYKRATIAVLGLACGSCQLVGSRTKSRPSQAVKINAVSQSEYIAAETLNQACQDPEVQKELRRHFLESKADFALGSRPEAEGAYRAGGREYEIFRRNYTRRYGDWPSMYRQLAADNHKLYREVHRFRLRERIRAEIVKNALVLETASTPFYSKAQPLVSKMPDQCSVLKDKSPSVWLDLQQKETKLRLVQRYNETLKDWIYPLLYSSLLARVYEIKLIEEIFLEDTWKNSALWQGEPIDGPFPPIYPVSSAETEFSFPGVRLNNIYQQVPILRRIGEREWLGNTRGQTMADLIFERVFMRGEKSIREQIIADIKADIDGYKQEILQNTDLKKINIHVYSPSQQKNIKLSTGQVAQLLGYQAFLTRDLSLFVANVVAKHLDGRKQRGLPTVNAAVSDLLDEAHRSWVSVLDDAKQEACTEHPDFLYGLDGEQLEELQGVVLSILHQEAVGQEKLTPEAAGYLDAYCHSNWGRTWQKSFEAGAEVAAGAGFVIGLAFPPTAAISLGAAALASASHVSRGLRGVQSLAIESALLQTSLASEINRTRENTFNFVAAPLAAATMLGGSYVIRKTGGFAAFNPLGKSLGNTGRALFWTYWLTGRAIDANTIYKQSPGKFDWTLFSANAFTSFTEQIFFARAASFKSVFSSIASIPVVALASYAANTFTQDVQFFLDDSNQGVDRRSQAFNFRWLMENTGPRQLLIHLLVYGAEKTVTKGNPGAKTVLASLMALTNSLVGSVWFSNSKVKFLNENISFNDAVRSLSIEDLNILSERENVRRIDIGYVPSRKETEQRLRAIQNLVKLYTSASEPGLDILRKQRSILIRQIQKRMEKEQQQPVDP